VIVPLLDVFMPVTRQHFRVMDINVGMLHAQCGSLTAFTLKHSVNVFWSQGWYQGTLFSVYAGANWEATTFVLTASACTGHLCSLHRIVGSASVMTCL